MNKTDGLFAQLLNRNEPIILDGGLATELENQGFDLSSNLWSAKLLLENPQAIIDAHRAYYDAGAQITISASYQATQKAFMSLGKSASESQGLITQSIQLAKIAREDFLRENPEIINSPLVAASIGPYGASLADGSEYTGNYDIDDKGLAEFHRQRLHWLDSSGADVLACETIPSRQEAQVLCELLLQVNTPAWISFSCIDGKRCCDGSSIAEIARLFVDHPKVLAIGINCTSPLHINSLIREIKSVSPGLAIVVYPNSGEHYHADTGSWQGTSSPIECGAAAVNWYRSGAKLIGGCCRMGPAHIKEISHHLNEERMRIETGN